MDTTQNVLIGILLSTLVLTRGIVLIPLALYFTKPFFALELKSKIKLISSGVLWGSFLIFIVLMHVPDRETLLHFNPLLLQTTQIPTSVIFVSLFLPFVFSFFHQGIQKNYFIYAVYLLLLPIVIGLFIKIWKFSFMVTLLESKFDISYLSLVFPFLIFAITQNNKFQLTQVAANRP